jgi:hypothetical protein
MRHLAAVLVVLLAGCTGPQTDAELQRNYDRNRVHFSTLAEGTVCAIGLHGILWRRNVTETTAACVELLDKIDAAGVGQDPFSEGIIVYPSGSNYSSHQKQYVFTKKKVTRLYSSLDKMPVDLQPYVRGYRKIDENWYISYEYVN